VLYGGRDIEFDTFNGARATIGYWFDDKATRGIEASGFVLERRADLFNVFGNGDPTGATVISRPLIDTTLPPPGEDVFVIAQPGVQAGGVTATASSRLWGAEGNLVCNYRDHCRQRIDLLAGFRYVDLLERLTINESSSLLGTPLAADEVDSFECRNQFYGGQLGARWTMCCGPLSLTTVSKLAMGFTHESITRLGSTTFFGFGPAPITVLGGQLVLPSNYGQDTRDRFAVVPATSLQVAYQMTKHASIFMGYDFLYISSVVRPGENIDRVLDPAGLPLPTGPGVVAARPAGGINGSDFYAHALTMGLSFTY
jgi:Putative beta barrel porin-7 (BBP7)